MILNNLKKRALPWLLTPVLGKNNFIFPRTGVKSQGKARFLRLELNIGRAKGSTYIAIVVCSFMNGFPSCSSFISKKMLQNGLHIFFRISIDLTI